MESAILGKSDFCENRKVENWLRLFSHFLGRCACLNITVWQDLQLSSGLRCYSCPAASCAPQNRPFEKRSFWSILRKFRKAPVASHIKFLLLVRQLKVQLRQSSRIEAVSCLDSAWKERFWGKVIFCENRKVENWPRLFSHFLGRHACLCITVWQDLQLSSLILV